MRILGLGDGACPTGFATVLHGVFGNLPSDWEIDHIAVNYNGDPHEYSWKIYPAGSKGDYLGRNRISGFLQDKEYDLIFMLNDIWVIDQYLAALKEIVDNDTSLLPPVVVYYPVDGHTFNPEWFKHFDIVTIPVVYTEFGRQVSYDAVGTLDFRVVPHATDLETFYDMGDRKEAKKEAFKNIPEELQEEYQNSFIVLNANRNQPRKMIPIALEGFRLFAEDKPKTVKYYHHAGIVDAGWDVIQLATRAGIDDRLIVTSLNNGPQNVTRERLNLIYNASDVGINTSLGEGWGLTATEHAVTGAPQVVPDHSACKELFEDCGVLVPVNQELVHQGTLTVGGLVHPADVASALNDLYYNRELFTVKQEAGKFKFTQEKYTWPAVAKRFEDIIKEACR